MSRFITVNITDQTKPVSQAGFGTAFILEPVTSETDEYEYTEVRSVDDIPETAGDLANDMANAYLSQSPLFCFDKTERAAKASSISSKVIASTSDLAIPPSSINCQYIFLSPFIILL